MGTDIEMSTLFDDCVQNVARVQSRFVERKLVEMIEARIGRVPTNDEVVARGMRLFDWPEREWTAYFWDNVMLFAYATEWADHRLVFRVREAKK